MRGTGYVFSPSGMRRLSTLSVYTRFQVLEFTMLERIDKHKKVCKNLGKSLESL